MIWCVEDDDSIRDIEVYALQSTGFEAKGFVDGDGLKNALKSETPDLIILDIMLPGEDGVVLLQYLKSRPQTQNTPIIMATAKGMEYDKVQSLDMGADDYIVKPFGMMEMISRVKAVLRRCETKKPQTVLCAEGIRLNTEEHTVTVDDQRIELTYKEYELLQLFLLHPGTAYTRDQLYSAIWDMDYVGETRTVDMHIRTLRQKLGKYGDRIETVRNVGYRLEVRK